MAQTTAHAFRLAFLTDRNETLAFNVPRANPALEPGEVAAAMQAMIDADVIQNARGIPRGRQSAELVTTRRTPYELFD